MKFYLVGKGQEIIQKRNVAVLKLKDIPKMQLSCSFEVWNISSYENIVILFMSCFQSCPMAAFQTVKQKKKGLVFTWFNTHFIEETVWLSPDHIVNNLWPEFSI